MNNLVFFLYSDVWFYCHVRASMYDPWIYTEENSSFVFNMQNQL